jgi:hypothetical protein
MATKLHKDGTETADRFIPHLMGPHGYMMPVKVWTNKNAPRTMSGAQAPQRDRSGNLIYALPGGGSMTHRGGMFETSQMIG